MDGAGEGAGAGAGAAALFADAGGAYLDAVCGVAGCFLTGSAAFAGVSSAIGAVSYTHLEFLAKQFDITSKK